jgi:hypothetical protein
LSRAQLVGYKIFEIIDRQPEIKKDIQTELEPTERPMVES